MGQLIIVSSVSGAGKTTLVDNAVKLYNLYKLRTCTTRPIRPEETGDEYYFYERDEFLDNVNRDQFFEYAKVYGNYYGLLNTEINKFNDGDCIVVLDVQGAATARRLYPNAITIFIEPPSLEELKFRIMKRNTGHEDVERRMNEINSEMSQINDFTHVVNYSSFTHMTENFNKLIKSVLN